MDKISVTDMSLQGTYIIIQQLNESSEAITEKCVSSLASQLGNLDSGMRKDIQSYIDEITKLKEKLKYCIDENTNAISDRFGKLPDYEKQTYKRRNFV